MNLLPYVQAYEGVLSLDVVVASVEHEGPASGDLVAFAVVSGRSSASESPAKHALY